MRSPPPASQRFVRWPSVAVSPRFMRTGRRPRLLRLSLSAANDGSLVVARGPGGILSNAQMTKLTDNAADAVVSGTLAVDRLPTAGWAVPQPSPQVDSRLRREATHSAWTVSATLSSLGWTAVSKLDPQSVSPSPLTSRSVHVLHHDDELGRSRRSCARCLLAIVPSGHVTRAQSMKRFARDESAPVILNCTGTESFCPGPRRAARSASGGSSSSACRRG